MLVQLSARVQQQGKRSSRLGQVAACPLQITTRDREHSAASLSELSLSLLDLCHMATSWGSGEEAVQHQQPSAGPVVQPTAPPRGGFLKL